MPMDTSSAVEQSDTGTGGGLEHGMPKSRCIEGYTRVVRRASSPLYVRNDLVASCRQCEDAAQ